MPHDHVEVQRQRVTPPPKIANEGNVGQVHSPVATNMSRQRRASDGGRSDRDKISGSGHRGQVGRETPVSALVAGTERDPAMLQRTVLDDPFPHCPDELDRGIFSNVFLRGATTKFALPVPLLKVCVVV